MYSGKANLIHFIGWRVRQVVHFRIIYFLISFKIAISGWYTEVKQVYEQNWNAHFSVIWQKKNIKLKLTVYSFWEREIYSIDKTIYLFSVYSFETVLKYLMVIEDNLLIINGMLFIVNHYS